MTRQKVTTMGAEAPRLFVDEGLLRDLLRTAAQAVLEEEVARHLGAGRHERPEGRRGHRNGSKPRTMKTAVGQLHLDVPQVREGGFRTSLFERHQRSDKALVAAMQEMVVSGVSTRRVGDVLEQMGGFEVSAATVSRAMAGLDGQVAAFFSRPLGGCEHPCIIVDARYEKVRKGGRVVSQAVMVVAGIRDDGRREFLSLAMGDSESEATWGDVLKDLRARGVRGVELVVSDARKGIQAALARHFQGTGWQRCKVHLMREMLRKVSCKDHKELAADLRSIYASEQREQCLAAARQVVSKWEARAPRMARALDEGVESTLTVWGLRRELARRLDSTNMLERTMKEIKQVTRKVGSFPNEAACRRLVGAVLLEMQDKWDEEKPRYLRTDEPPK